MSIEARLAELGVTLPDAPAPHDSYLFRHAITQQVTYGLMLAGQRQALGARAGDREGHSRARRAALESSVISRRSVRRRSS